MNALLWYEVESGMGLILLTYMNEVLKHNMAKLLEQLSALKTAFVYENEPTTGAKYVENMF